MVKKYCVYPAADVTYTITPSRKLQFSALLSSSLLTPSLALRSDDVIRRNEFLFVKGNPNVAYAQKLSFTPIVVWVLSNTLYTRIFCAYEHTFNPFIIKTYPYADGRGVVQQLSTCKSQDFVGPGFTVFYNPLRKLNINATVNPRLWFNDSENIKRQTTCSYTLNAYYYVGNFGFSCELMYYGNPFDELNEVVAHNVFQYIFGASWSNGPLQVSLTAGNIFSNSYKGYSKDYSSEFYRYHEQTIMGDFHRNFSLKVAYTFSYGKKVEKKDELNSAAEASSAIMR